MINVGCMDTRHPSGRGREWPRAQAMMRATFNVRYAYGVAVLAALLGALLLIVGLENQYESTLNWNLVVIPGGMLAIARAIKLVDLNQ